MATYLNHSQTVLSFSLPEIGDIIMHPGMTAELPDGNAHVRALVGKKYLIKVDGPAKNERKFNPKKKKK